MGATRLNAPEPVVTRTVNVRLTYVQDSNLRGSFTRPTIEGYRFQGPGSPVYNWDSTGVKAVNGWAFVWETNTILLRGSNFTADDEMDVTVPLYYVKA